MPHRSRDQAESAELRLPALHCRWALSSLMSFDVTGADHEVHRPRLAWPHAWPTKLLLMIWLYTTTEKGMKTIAAEHVCLPLCKPASTCILFHRRLLIYKHCARDVEPFYVSRMEILVSVWHCWLGSVFPPSGEREMQLESLCPNLQRSPSCSFKDLF